MSDLTFLTVAVFVIAVSLGIGRCVVFPSLNKEAATAGAMEWAKTMYPEAENIRVACQSIDTDDDSYVSCTARIDAIRVPLECAGTISAKLGNGCREQKLSGKLNQLK